MSVFPNDYFNLDKSWLPIFAYACPKVTCFVSTLGPLVADDECRPNHMSYSDRRKITKELEGTLMIFLF